MNEGDEAITLGPDPGTDEAGTDWTCSGNDLEAGLPEILRSIVRVGSIPLCPDEFAAVSEALWLAASTIVGVISVPRPASITVARAPFTVMLGNGVLRFDPAPTTAHACVNDLIFIDVARLLQDKPAIRVACILEELVHVLLNVRDEELVKVIVGWLYNGVEYVEGAYVAIEVESEHREAVRAGALLVTVGRAFAALDSEGKEQAERAAGAILDIVHGEAKSKPT